MVSGKIPAEESLPWSSLVSSKTPAEETSGVFSGTVSGKTPSDESLSGSSVSDKTPAEESLPGSLVPNQVRHPRRRESTSIFGTR